MESLMKIRDQNGLQWACDRCDVTIKGYGDAKVALHGPDVRVFHARCAAESYQFVHNEASRELTVSAFLAELQAAAGL
jgi:hypothetical protein